MINPRLLAHAIAIAKDELDATPYHKQILTNKTGRLYEAVGTYTQRALSNELVNQIYTKLGGQGA